MVVSAGSNVIEFCSSIVPQYTYALTVPMIFCAVFGFMIIKYREGFLEVPGLGSESQNLESPTLTLMAILTSRSETICFLE